MKAIAAAFALVFAAAPAAAHQYQAGQLTIGHPWSRPAAAGMNGAGYLTVTNAGPTADTLLAVETPGARQVDIHEGSMTGGVMRMKKLPHGLTIPAGKTVTLAPGGNHLMMLQLRQPLKVGDKVPATLVFKKAGRVDVSFSVQAAAPAPGPMPMPMPMPEHHH